MCVSVCVCVFVGVVRQQKCGLSANVTIITTAVNARARDTHKHSETDIHTHLNTHPHTQILKQSVTHTPYELTLSLK